MKKRLLVLAQVLIAAGVAVSTSAADPPPGGGGGVLCGITQPTDEILNCPGDGGGSGATGGNQSSAPDTQSSAPDTQPSAPPTSAEPPVRRVSPIPRYVPDLLLLKFKPGTPPNRRRQVLDAAGVVVERRIDQIGAMVVRMSPERRDEALATLQASPWVTSAEKDAVVEALQTIPNDTDWGDQWGLRTINLPSAWDRTHGSSSVLVAVLDTGVDTGPPDLRGAVRPGFDLVNGDSDASDDHGHGTAVAGVITARTNNGRGMAGVCWACSILPIKVLAADGVGDLGVVAAGIVRAVDAGAHVINLSLGGPAGDQTLDDAVAYAVRNGAIVVAAAGNNGDSSPFYPAASPGVVSVAATDASDHLYPWSNFGQWATIAAPGCNLATGRDGGYGTFCGTSSATPIVSGLIALALSAQPGAARDEILTALEQTTTSVGEQVAHGRINAAAALGALPQSALPPSPAETSTLTLRGALTPRAPLLSYRQAVADGMLIATLAFTGTRTLTLAIRNSSGSVVARRTGPSPIRIRREVAAGSVLLEVAGPRRTARFSLTVAYPRAAVATAEVPVSGQPPSPKVLLSPVPQIPAGTALAGPQLGAPPGRDTPDTTMALGFSISEQPSLPFLSAINRLRRAHGLGAVAWSPALSRAAFAHVRELAGAGQFTHDWDDGTPFATWIVRYYPPLAGRSWLAGENLLWSSAEIAPADAIVAWLGSPAHRRILLDPSWRELGVGIVAVKEAPGAYGGHDAIILGADFGTRPPARARRQASTS